MSCYDFSEIHFFDLDNFIPYMGWIGAKVVKIYTLEGAYCYYLFDEELLRLFEVHFNASEGEITKFRYNQVVDDYRDWRQHQPQEIPQR